MHTRAVHEMNMKTGIEVHSESTYPMTSIKRERWMVAMLCLGHAMRRPIFIDSVCAGGHGLAGGGWLA